MYSKIGIQFRLQTYHSGWVWQFVSMQPHFSRADFNLAKYEHIRNFMDIGQ